MSFLIHGERRHWYLRKKLLLSNVKQNAIVSVRVLQRGAGDSILNIITELIELRAKYASLESSASSTQTEQSNKPPVKKKKKQKLLSSSSNTAALDNLRNLASGHKLLADNPTFGMAYYFHQMFGLLNSPRLYWSTACFRFSQSLIKLSTFIV